MALLRILVITITCGLAFVGRTTTPAHADGMPDRYAAGSATERGVYFSGYDGVTGSNYYFSGAIFALNGDLSKNGFAVRVYGSYDEFDNNNLGNGRNGDGRQWQGDVMLGYLFNRPHWSGGVYIGGDYQNVRLSPDDPTEKVRGTEFGFKVAGDIATERDLPYYFSLNGSYSTAFETYWTRVRLGLTRHKVAFGIEGAALGDESFDAQRIGGFVIFDCNLILSRPLEITLAAGHQFVGQTNGTTNTGIGGGEGTYGTVVFSVPF